MNAAEKIERRRPRLAIRLVAVLMLTGLGLAILWPSLRDAKRRVLLDATLRELELGLERHRGLEGTLPSDPLLPASELIWLLRQSGALEAAPINPYTGARYGEDPFELDQIWYSPNESGETWTLEALSEDGERVVTSRRSSTGE